MCRSEDGWMTSNRQCNPANMPPFAALRSGPIELTAYPSYFTFNAVKADKAACRSTCILRILGRDSMSFT